MPSPAGAFAYHSLRDQGAPPNAAAALPTSGVLAAEAAGASPLQTVQQDLLGAVNGPTEALPGRPLIGSGGNAGTAGTGDPPGASGQPGSRGALFGEPGSDRSPLPGLSSTSCPITMR